MERFNAAFDGGSRGNPGPAAWGVAVLDAGGRCLERHAGTLGRATNNVAEYHGLIEALRLATQKSASEVRLRSDSELIVRQLQGRYKVKHPDLKPLFAEAKRMIAGLALFDIRHVRREDNKEADALVNEALDRHEADPGTAVRIHDVREPKGG
ncbi:MAG: reverse transcriptase-like protein [Acidobacteria bacterium]|nr:reverse transcriptase-like protein [Acidobacteriota bacterium]NIM64000.1 reverse transcriptase-like protein [Acidobacteriota bacterium]NIO60206.1 reverse transcriptase-like protein [Acidobacteriota bacterium]NIQ31268.1 reverse transcriptase-like protein [Acidobacteriota bacterium]NIQ86416.1 reverse transcriptase-like protein [Acidobacteriota bacterium]